MDTSGFSQVGRYGTLSLLKRRTSIAANANGPNDATQGGMLTNDLITSFGIDSNELTFGSSSTCGVRLYYPDVDALHCKIIFEDGKAFLAVLGKEGVLVDRCWIYPHTSSGGSRSSEEQEQQKTIIPISNNSEFEIHNKRFKFTYPPKEVRKTVMATPTLTHKRALRLSMIHSAQVFSPRPSKDPRENLRILQSPLKGIFGTKTPTKAGQTPARTRAVSPLKYGTSGGDSDDSDEDKQTEQQESLTEGQEDGDEDSDEEEIILVQTNHPRVVEEERDLVILEDVLLVPENAPASPSMALQQAQPQAQAAPPLTPRRKSMGGTALHRAVLIRSAQRAVWKAEKDREEEEEREEEMEVLGAVVDPVEVDGSDKEESDSDGGEEREWDDNDVEMRSVSSEEDDATDEDEEEKAKKRAEQKPLWRKSLEKIIPWPFTGKAGEEEDDQDETPEVETEETERHKETQEQEQEEDKDEQRNENEILAPLPLRPAQTPMRRALGSFMTPQPQNQAKRDIFPQTQVRTNMAPPALPQAAPAATPLPAPSAGRFSLGGGEARRVVVQQPWKVKDLVLPPIVPNNTSTPAASGSNALPTRAQGGLGMSMPPPSTPMRVGVDAAAGPRPTPVVTEEERRAIQERRRSAVREFKEDNFWKDGAPGMSPAKNSARSATPSAAGDRRSLSTSPVKHGVYAMQLGEDRSAMAMATPRKAAFTSPTKGRALGYAIAEEGDSMSVDRESTYMRSESNPRDSEDAEEEDTQSLLERMRETVEDMKRRRSMVMRTPRINNTPAVAPVPPSALASEVANPPAVGMPIPSSAALTTPTRPTSTSFGLGSVKKLDFSRITPAKPPSRTKSPAPTFDAQEVEEPFSLLRPGARDTPSGPSSSRKPPSRDLRGRSETREMEQREVTAVPLPVVVVEVEGEYGEEMDVEPKATKAKARGRSKVLRTPKAVEAENDEASKEVDEPAPSKPKSKSAAKPMSKPRSRTAKSPALASLPETTPAAATLAPATRRGRSKTPQPMHVDDETDDVPTAAKRTQRGTAELEEPTPAPTRRGRKATIEPEEQAEVEADAAEPEMKTTKIPTVKRGRKPRTTPAVIEEEQEEEDAAPAPALVKRSRSKKAVVAAPVEDDDDELDSYDVQPAASGSKIKTSVPVKALTKGRKKAAVVKQEPEEEGQEEEGEPAPLAATRGGRGAKGNTITTARTPAAAKTPAGTGTTAASKLAKPRGRPKTPATAPAATAASRIASGSALNVASSEKENAPGDASGSVGSDDAEDPPVKVRVSRKTTTATASGTTKASKIANKSATKSTTTKATSRSKVKVEEHEEQSDEVATTTKTRATRVMRTRTKTS